MIQRVCAVLSTMVNWKFYDMVKIHLITINIFTKFVALSDLVPFNSLKNIKNTHGGVLFFTITNTPL